MSDNNHKSHTSTALEAPPRGSLAVETVPCHFDASATTTATMATRRPLSGAENLAVGAFGGIVETCVQSA